MPSRFFGIAVAVLAASAWCRAQEGSKPQAEITRSGDSTVVDAVDRRPLMQAVEGAAEEYGWLVDYEDPIYDPITETVDADDASWISAHPERLRIKLPAGHQLHAEFSSGKGIPDKKSILQILVDANAKSGNPGKFAVLSERDGGLVVTGTSGGLVGPVLSTRISIPRDSRTLHETLNAVLEQLKLKTDTTIVLSTAPYPMLDQVQVTVGGEDVPARDLLRSAFYRSGITLHWTMLFEPTLRQFHFNIQSAGPNYPDSGACK